MTAVHMANDGKLDSTRLVALLGPWSIGTGPLYRQLADAVDGLIEQGQLRTGDLLPPERRLADALAASRSTVVAAFDLLRDRGRVERRQGSGTRVVGPPLATSVGQEFRTTPLFVPGAEITALLKAVPERMEAVDLEVRRWANELGAADVDTIDPEGILALRTAIAERYTRDGLPTTADAIIVTTGAQQAISLAVAAVCGPGDVVVTEETTWPGLFDVVARQGGRCFGVRMDEGGIDTDELRAAVERHRPVAIALNPHHHNPTGTRLLPHRRRAVADIAAEYGVIVIEDRVAAPLAFDDVVAAPLATHRYDAPIATVDSLSKTVWPGLRIGWLRAAPDLVRQVRMAKAIDDMFTPIPSQEIAVRLVRDLDAHVATRVEQLRRREAVAHEALATLLPDWEVARPDGGLMMWARLPAPVATAFIAHAARCGVLLAGAEAFAVSPPTNDRIRIAFSAPEPQLVAAIERTAEAWSTFRES
ncbi:MAG: PLP-dependent aminotransferase family protein [Acidimicrobiales bacterium]